jgi:Bacterial Ig-like domain
MGIPVVIATNGYGTPVTLATNGYGLPVEIASNGYGMPVVLVANGGMPVVGSFGPDVTAPLAVSFSPTDNATGVSVSTNLIVQFNEPVTLGAAGNITLKRTSDNVTIEAWNVATEAGTGAGQVNVFASTQLTMRLTTSLAGGIEYYVIWDAGVVKDIAGNNVAAQASTTLWSFTTLGSSYDAATEAIAAAFTTPPTTARKNLIDACVVSLKSAGVWAKLDALYAFAAADSQAAKINWVNPGTFNCTEVNAPTFTADQGFTGASTKYLDTGFNPTTASSPKYVQDSASVFGWSLTDIDLTSGPLIGNAASTLYMLPRQANTAYLTLNNAFSAFVYFANAAATGFLSGVRDSSSTLKFYKNGAAQTTTSNPGSFSSAALSNGNHFFLRQGTNYWTGQIAAGGFGQQLSAADNTALYNALRTYLTGVGVP